MNINHVEASGSCKMENPVVEQTWLDEETALKAAARKGWGFESLLLRHFLI